MKSAIAIIPARGGSKRLPQKNIKDLFGKPIIAWVIERALESGVFSRVIVSSEDSHILGIAENWGAEVHMRSSALATDTAKVVDVCLDVLSQYDVEHFCCLYPTAALVSAGIYKRSYEVFVKKKPDVLMSVASYTYSPFQALIENDDGFLKFLNAEYLGVQSQFFPKVCVDAGAFYWAKSEVFLADKTFYPDKLLPYVLPDGMACDVNTEQDFERLKTMLKTNEDFYPS